MVEQDEKKKANKMNDTYIWKVEAPGMSPMFFANRTLVEQSVWITCHKLPQQPPKELDERSRMTWRLANGDLLEADLVILYHHPEHL